jgi:hypothetical protein
MGLKHVSCALVWWLSCVSLVACLGRHEPLTARIDSLFCFGFKSTCGSIVYRTTSLGSKFFLKLHLIMTVYTVLCKHAKVTTATDANSEDDR